MPRTRVPTIRADAAADVMTVQELAALIRVDPRTLRVELEAGLVGGAFKVGRSWRIVRSTFLASIEAGHHARL
jgi:hypothetical protein